MGWPVAPAVTVAMTVCRLPALSVMISVMRLPAGRSLVPVIVGVVSLVAVGASTVTLGATVSTATVSLPPVPGVPELSV